MKRQFALPIVIAALLHASLLLGVRGNSANTLSTSVNPVPPREPDKPRIEVAPLPEPEADASKSAKSSSTEPAPTLPDHPGVPRPTDFTVAVQKPTEAPRTTITVIPQGPPGIPGGSESGFGNRPSAILRLGDLDNVPQARFQAQPDYPMDARRKGQDGDVLVEFAVDERGAVSDARVVNSSDRVFEDPALRAVLKWRFTPGLRDGRPVRFRMVVPIGFRVSEN